MLYLAGVWLLTACAMFGIMFWAPLLISDMFNAGSAAAPKEEGASCGGGALGMRMDAAALHGDRNRLGPNSL